MPRSKRHRKGDGKKIYSVIVDGETEIWYFQLMRAYEKLSQIDVKPELPQKKKLKEQYETIIENAKHYYKVIWILDLDTLVKESKETKGGQKSKIQEFKEYVEKLKKYKNIEILVNTPYLEFWYLLHFEPTGKYFSKCESAIKELRKSYLKDYNKSQKFYKKQDNNFYKKLKPYQKKAILNAEKLGDFDFKEPQLAKAEIYKVFQLLGI